MSAALRIAADPSVADRIDRGIDCYAAGQIIGCDHSRVRKLVKDGELRAYRAGRSIRVYLSSVEEYRRRNAIKPSAGASRQTPTAASVGGPAHREAVAALARLGLKF